ncbi:FAD-dependent oxidoreductase [bacterium]|nr:FAD-dependent oxidoreductase [bacterium]
MRIRLWLVLFTMFSFLGNLPLWSQERPQVVVVGGGIAGLVTAFKLEQRGYRCCLLEASDRLGGRIGTAHYPQGLEAEYGMQEIWEKSPLIGIIKELGLQLEASDDPWSSLLIDEKLYAFTEDTREQYFLKLFTPVERKAFDATIAELESCYTEATSKGLTAKMLKLQNQTFAEWLQERKLPSKVEQAVRLTIEVELATVAEKFSALSAVLEYRTFLFGGEKNYHVPGGNSVIIGKLGEALKGPKVMGATVTHVVRRQENGRLVAEVRYLKNSTEQKIQADAVVMAVPWVILHQIQFEPALTAPQLKALSRLGRGQYTVIHMLLDKAVAGLWAKADPFPVLSNAELGVIYGPHATDTNGPEIVFSFLIYGPEAEAYHMAPRDIKRSEVLEGMDAVWPGFSKYVHETFFYSYHPAAVTYWPKGRSPLDELSEAIRTPHLGLFLAGDWTESSHAEGAVRSAILASEKVDSYLKSLK